MRSFHDSSRQKDDSGKRGYEQLLGMYQMSVEDVKIHKEQLKKKEKLRIVRQESIMELMANPDSGKARDVANRLFHNAEVIEAKGNEVGRKVIA